MTYNVFGETLNLALSIYLSRKDLWNRCASSVERYSDRVMNCKSVDNENDELTCVKCEND